MIYCTCSYGSLSLTVSARLVTTVKYPTAYPASCSLSPGDGSDCCSVAGVAAGISSGAGLACGILPRERVEKEF